MIYFVFGYLVLLSFLKINSRKMLFITAILPIILITVFRYGLGADYFSYEMIYESFYRIKFLSLFSQNGNMEILFKVIMWFFSNIGLSYFAFNALISSIIVFLIVMWIFCLGYDSKITIYAVMLFYGAFLFVWSWSALRQGLSLSIVLFVIYNRKFKFQPRTKLLFVFLASLFHYSALINLIYLYIPSLSLRTLIKTMSIILITTFIPIASMLSYFLFIPGVEKLMSYVNITLGFWNFPGLIRIILFLFGALFYDRFSSTEFNKKIISNFMLGIIIYFVFNSLPIAAGRLNIYTLILLVAIIPEFAIQYNKLIVKLGVIAFSFVFMLKESKTLMYQSGINSNSFFIPYINIFNHSEYTFDSFYYNYNKYYKSIEETFNSYIQHDNVEVEPNTMNKFKVVFNNDVGYFGVINQFGKVTHGFKYYMPMQIYENYMFQYFDNKGITQYNVTDLYTNEGVYVENCSKFIPKTATELQRVFLKQIEFSEIGFDYSSLYTNKDRLSNPRLIELQLPYEYDILVLEYYGVNTFVYLDKNHTPIINKYFMNYSLIDDQGFLESRFNGISEVYNSAGELVWIYRYDKDL